MQSLLLHGRSLKTVFLCGWGFVASIHSLPMLLAQATSVQGGSSSTRVQRAGLLGSNGKQVPVWMLWGVLGLPGSGSLKLQAS